MRKKVLGLVMAAIAVSTFGAFAQSQPSQSQVACEQVEGKCPKAKKDKKCKGDSDCKRGKKDRFNPFEGIELTAEQQQKIDQLRAERKANKENAKKAKKEARAQEKKQFDEKMAQILTPEQYAKYEANCKAAKPGKLGKTKAKLDKSQKARKGDLKAKGKKERVDSN